MEGEVISLQDIFRFDRRGLTDEGGVIGQYVSTGIRPQFINRLEKVGIQLPAEYFFPPPPPDQSKRSLRRVFEGR